MRRRAQPLPVRLLLAILPALVMAQATATHAATLYVQNWGVDAPACGSTTSPCRSITKALSLAALIDTILVGPGIYGDDLNGNLTYGEPGEEATPITIDKSVKVLSTHGAMGTVIAQTNGPNDAVHITAPNVVFGSKNKGFTVALREGWIGVLGTSSSGVTTIAGNTIVMTPFSPGGPFTNGIVCIVGNSRAVIKDNEVIGYNNSNLTTSISVGITAAASSTVENLIDHNAVGNCSLGFEIEGGRWSMTNNSAGGNLGDGISSGFGFHFGPSNPPAVTKFQGNNATFNAAGIVVDEGTFASFTGNTFVANTTNCGVKNKTAAALDATSTFWGSASGPGADPADDVCNVGTSTTTTSPFGIVDTTPKQHPRR